MIRDKGYVVDPPLVFKRVSLGKPEENWRDLERPEERRGDLENRGQPRSDSEFEGDFSDERRDHERWWRWRTGNNVLER
ncbi:hypothetical protein TNCV_4408151 [Trichonephila clavipes]|nr:hypothetical protein TNCV_4408151 [Trichonephila clavipes]